MKTCYQNVSRFWRYILTVRFVGFLFFRFSLNMFVSCKCLSHPEKAFTVKPTSVFTFHGHLTRQSSRPSGSLFKEFLI